MALGVLHEDHDVQTCERPLVEHKLVQRGLRVQVTVLVFIAFIVVIVVLIAALIAIFNFEEVVLELSLLFQVVIELLGSDEVALVIAVVVVSLADLVVQFEVQLPLPAPGLLVLNAPDPF